MWTSGFLLLALSVVCVYCNSVDVVITDNGDGKFEALITVTPTEQINGWEVAITFGSAVTDVDVCILSDTYLKSQNTVDLCASFFSILTLDWFI